MNFKRMFTSFLVSAVTLLLLTGLVFAQETDATPLGTVFTYQGQLLSSGTPYSGSCDFQFGLYDAATMGTTLGELTITDVSVSEGIFTTQLDFGSGKFIGDNRWLEIGVRCPVGGGTYQQLLPRQPLTAAPYALYALDAGFATNALYAASADAVPWSGITSMPAGFADWVDDDTTYAAGSGLTLTGTTFSADTAIIQARVNGVCGSGYAINVINADGTVLCEPVAGGGNPWSLTGNAGTTPGTNFLGTTDNQALEVHVANSRVFRFEPNAASPNLIGGYFGNWITSGVYGATINGGGQDGLLSRVTDNFGTIGGGADNQAGNNDAEFLNNAYATVSGGSSNTASGSYSTINGGSYNIASAAYTTISGGGPTDPDYNPTNTNNRATDNYCTVGGGCGNQAGDNDTDIESSMYATVSGGKSNKANELYSTVSGGSGNIASGIFSTVSGGYHNTASGSNSTISGGFQNLASSIDTSVGGGTGNSASGIYSTVPGGYDNTAAGAYSFAAGYRAEANNESCFVWGDFSVEYDALDVECNLNNQWVARASGGVYFYTAPNLMSGSYLYMNGSSWNAVSNREVKENFSPVDTSALLEHLAQYPIAAWNYKSQDDTILHVGMMADEFNNLMPGLGGEGEDYINTMDAVGVSLAAVQGLYAENLELKSRVDDLETRLTALENNAGISNGGHASSGTIKSSWKTTSLLGIGMLAVVGVWYSRRVHRGDK